MQVHSLGRTLMAAVFSLLAYFKLRKTEARLVPEPKGTLTNVFEVMVEKLLELMEERGS